MSAALPKEHFEIARALLSPVNEYLAGLLHTALDASGVGADERALRDLLLPAVLSDKAVECFTPVKTAYTNGVSNMSYCLIILALKYKSWRHRLQQPYFITP